MWLKEQGNTESATLLHKTAQKPAAVRSVPQPFHHALHREAGSSQFLRPGRGIGSDMVRPHFRVKLHPPSSWRKTDGRMLLQLSASNYLSARRKLDDRVQMGGRHHLGETINARLAEQRISAGENEIDRAHLSSDRIARHVAPKRVAQELVAKTDTQNRGPLRNVLSERRRGADHPRQAFRCVMR